MSNALDYVGLRPTQRRARGLCTTISTLLLLLSLFVTACSSPATGAAPTAPSGPSTDAQLNEDGQVKISVTFLNATYAPAFKVVMDTHAVDLDQYDLRNLAVLRTDAGLEALPTTWDAPLGGDHRGGTLTFSPSATNGSPLFGPTSGAIELVIRDVAGVPERSFRWQL